MTQPITGYTPVAETRALEVPAAEARPAEAPTPRMDDVALDQRELGRGAAINPQAGFLARAATGAMGRAQIGRGALAEPRTIRLFGRTLDRVAPAIREPRPFENDIAGLLGGLFANRGPLSDGDKIDDHRSLEAVQAAVAKPKITEGAPLGPLTFFRPGLGNTAPGPAQIARLAQYTDKLVILFANPGQGVDRQLRAVDAVDGIPLPPQVKGKVFAIGSPDNLMVTFEQASDLFLEQLDLLARSPLLGLGVKGLEHAKATVVAHSQGGLDALLTRRRLQQAGLGDVFGKLATLATPFRGSPVANEDMVGLLSEVGERAFDLQSMGAVNALDPDHVKEVITDKDQRLVDLSLIGQTHAGQSGREDIRRFFKVSDVAIGVERSLPALFQGRDVRENDGLVTVSSQAFGAAQRALEKSYDHAGIAEDPSVADEVVRGLLGSRQSTVDSRQLG